jgi:hypothetical protein
MPFKFFEVLKRRLTNFLGIMPHLKISKNMLLEQRN